MDALLPLALCPRVPTSVGCVRWASLPLGFYWEWSVGEALVGDEEGMRKWLGYLSPRLPPLLGTVWQGQGTSTKGPAPIVWPSPTALSKFLEFTLFLLLQSQDDNTSPPLLTSKHFSFSLSPPPLILLFNSPFIKLSSIKPSECIIYFLPCL